MSRSGMDVIGNQTSRLPRKLRWANTLRRDGVVHLKVSLPILAFVISLVLFASMTTAQPGQPANAAVTENSNLGSERSRSTKNAIRIDVNSPLKEPMRHSLSGMEPPTETPLEFNGDGRKWSFIKFDRLPDQTTVIVNGDPTPYKASEELKAGEWYPFRQMLPVILKINGQAKAPVELGYWFGSPTDNDAKYFTTNPSPDDVRLFASAHSLKQDTDKQVLALYWGPSVISIEPPAVTFQVGESEVRLYEKVALRGDSKLWTFVRMTQPVDVVDLVVTTSEPKNLSVKTATQLKAGEWIGFRDSVTLEFSLSPTQVDSEGDTSLTLEFAIAQSPDQTKDSVTEDIKAGKIVATNGTMPLHISWQSTKSGISPFQIVAGILGVIALVAFAIVLWKLINKPTSRNNPERKAKENQRGPVETGKVEPSGRRRDMLGINKGATTAPATPTSVTRGASTTGQTAVPAGRGAMPASGNSAVQQEVITRLQDDLEQLRTELRQKANQTPGIPATQEYLAHELSNLRKQLNKDFQTELEERLRKVATAQAEQTARLESSQKIRGEEISKLRTRDEDINKSIEINFQNIIEAETRLTGQLEQLEEMLIEQAFPESFFARTMGMILSKNIDELQEGNFERLIGERINQFFQTGAPRGESLQDLRLRAEEIVAALKRVEEIMTSKNRDVEDETRVRLQRAEALLAKISGLQTQFQSRKITIETTLRIPVSAYEGARQTFLDELGRGIRSEIDKLGDPQNYFEGDLERLVTADLIAIVDICDKKVCSPPGSYAELEAALKQLFQHAGLREIVPRPGEPFGTAEQDLIQMVPGDPGKSMTVAQVITRGFYYTHRDNETLLRKAGVVVYR
ncbi:MAG: nucleotide exchange factor GrpE [Acidobacteriota bacterium]